MTQPGTRARLVAPVLFAVLFAASAAVLLASQEVRGRLIVDRVAVTGAFEPSAGEKAKVRFRLTEDEDRASVTIIGDDGESVAELARDEPLGDYEIHRFRWGGAGAVAPGRYEVRLTLASLDRELVLGPGIELRGPAGKDGGDG